MSTAAVTDVRVEIAIPFGPRRGGLAPRPSAPRADAATREAYAEALVREIDALACDYEGRRVAGIHVTGNGPATLSADELGRVLSELRSRFDVRDGAEVLMDAVPGHLSRRQLHEFLNVGVTRFDLEFPTMDFQEFQRLGLAYDIADVRETTWMMRQEEFRSFGVRVPVGIPLQTARSLRLTLLEAQSLGVYEVALVPAVVRGGTPFAEAIRGGESLGMIDVAGRAGAFAEARDALCHWGYRPVGASTFAFEGKQAAHLALRAGAMDVVGVGAGARTWSDGYTYANTRDVALYIEASDDPVRVCEGAAIVDAEAQTRHQVAAKLMVAGELDAREPGAREPGARELDACEAEATGPTGPTLAETFGEILAQLVASGHLARAVADEGQGRGDVYRVTDLGAMDPVAFEARFGQA